MAASFAALESRVNRAVFSRLANTEAILDGVTVEAIFDNAYALGNVGPIGIAGTQPALTLATTSVPVSPVGKSAVVGGVGYTIAEHQPDGTGSSVLYLEHA